MVNTGFSCFDTSQRGMAHHGAVAALAVALSAGSASGGFLNSASRREKYGPGKTRAGTCPARLRPAAVQYSNKFRTEENTVWGSPFGGPVPIARSSSGCSAQSSQAFVGLADGDSSAIHSRSADRRRRLRVGRAFLRSSL